METIQPFLNHEEEAQWHKARAEYKAWQLAHMDSHLKKIEDIFT